jgi:RimJ/RimL family protein N-acetyltransferase
MPDIHKAAALNPAFRSHFRLVEASDAAFIYRLRQDPGLNPYLSPPPPSIEAQAEWIKGYKLREADGREFYFVIVCDGQDKGVVRLYDFREMDGRRSFCWGSWIIPPPKVEGLAVYSAILVYEVGFEALGCEQSHFEVDNRNVGVIGFHQRAGATFVSADEIEHHFIYTPQAFEVFRLANRERVGMHRLERHPAPRRQGTPAMANV